MDITKEMIDAELELEEEACNTARDRLEAMLQAELADGRADETAVGKKIVSYTFDRVRDAIADALEKKIEKRGGGTISAFIPFVRSVFAAWMDAGHEVDDLYDIIALAVISTAIGAALDSTRRLNSVSAAGIAITRQILDEVHLYAIANKDGKLKCHVKSLKKRVSVRNKQIYVRHILNTHAEIKIDAVNSIKTQWGAWLLQTAIASGLCDFVVIGREGKLSRVLPTQLLINTFNKNADKLLSLAHRFIPTIIPPAPWSDPQNGGYYGRIKAYANLIRLQDCSTQYIHDYQNRLRQLDISDIYSAINAYQETAYHINQRVYETLAAVVEKGGDMAGIPRMTEYEPVAEIPEDADAETVATYKQRRVDWIHREIVRKSKALRTMATLGAAKKYKDYDRIYFPVNMDWRGRLYPMPTAITPQGDDVQKSLLEFADPAEIKTDKEGVDALYWLKVHIANEAGHDKLPFADRVKWTEENAKDILTVANDPLGDGLKLWIDADAPCCYLAACFAYKDIMDYQKQYGTLAGCKCGLPIAMDATCSVLQHFSSIMRDPWLAKLVNLTDCETTQDVYAEVAVIVNEKVHKDAETGTADENKTSTKDGKPYVRYGTKTLAQRWLDFARQTTGEDKISRSITKKCVMTYGYGSGLYGFQERIFNEHVQPYRDDVGGTENSVFGISERQAAKYLGKVIYESVIHVLDAVEQTKNYIISAVDAALDEGLQIISWTTPDGLLVQSSYNILYQKKIQLTVCNKHLTVYSNDDTEAVDKHKQAQAIAPNYIHSRDAAHMRIVLNTCKAAGMKNYMMIHDSFGVEAVNVARLHKILRETFVEMYKQDALAEFVGDLKHVAPLAEIKELPAKGKFEIEEVLKAKYAFC